MTIGSNGQQLSLSFTNDICVHLLTSHLRETGSFLCDISTSRNQQATGVLPPSAWGVGKDVYTGTQKLWQEFRMEATRTFDQVICRSIAVCLARTTTTIINEDSDGNAYSSVTLNQTEWQPINAFLLWLQTHSPDDHMDSLHGLHREILTLVRSQQETILLPAQTADIATLLLAPRH